SKEVAIASLAGNFNQRIKSGAKSTPPPFANRPDKPPTTIAIVTIFQVLEEADRGFKGFLGKAMIRGRIKDIPRPQTNIAVSTMSISPPTYLLSMDPMIVVGMPIRRVNTTMRLLIKCSFL